jgi:IS1 family transposase
MACYQEIVCPACGSNEITKSGCTEQGTQRYRCKNEDCTTKTFDWGAYERHLPTDQHEVGKKHTQKIERKNLNLRTWHNA